MARPNRVKSDGEGYYHVIDRIAHREFLLRDERIKKRLLDLVRRAAEFSGVDVCTYVLMDNHLHLCVHVPEAGEIGERTVVERVGALYGEPRAIRGLSVIGMAVDTCRRANAPDRDLRLVNGLVVGGIGFVREMTGRLIAKFRGSPTLRKVGTFGSASLYASHGGRSAPRRVA